MAQQKKTLYQHIPHPHMPKSVHDRIQADQDKLRAAGGISGKVNAFNLWLAKNVTLAMGTMWCAYGFMLLALSGFPGFHANLAQLVQWFSQTFLQLISLPVLAVGTAYLNQHAEHQADEQYNATMRSLHSEEQVANHLDAQDTELLKQTRMIADILATVNERLALPETPPTA